jgi:LPS export ABC transporter protein LptC
MIDRLIFILPIVCFLIIGCSDDGQITNIKDYDGPMYELTNVETFYSTKRDDTSAFLTYKLMADRQLIMENQDMRFPDGLYIENYSPEGTIAVTIRGNAGYYNKKENIYRAVGDVVVRNMEEEQTLNTEELFWKPGAGDESIYTDKHVIIKTPTETIYGDGLRAPENFETYRILNPTGTITIQE